MLVVRRTTTLHRLQGCFQEQVKKKCEKTNKCPLCLHHVAFHLTEKLLIFPNKALAAEKQLEKVSKSQHFPCVQLPHLTSLKGRDGMIHCYRLYQWPETECYYASCVVLGCLEPSQQLTAALNIPHLPDYHPLSRLTACGRGDNACLLPPLFLASLFLFLGSSLFINKWDLYVPVWCGCRSRRQ